MTKTEKDLIYVAAFCLGGVVGLRAARLLARSLEKALRS